jgi:glycolate oxidase FAD binding subunit
MTPTSANIAMRLKTVIGAAHLLSDPAACAAYGVDGIAPTAVAKPSSAGEVAEIVRFAALENLALIPCGSRTKLAIGMPPSRHDIALDMTALDQIAHYDPGDLTLSVDAGMPLAKLNAVLFEHKQFLPLLVPWYSRATIGGTIASGIHSPLQQFYGTARDFLIGAEFITGSGALTKSGGHVVKNVTGYDLHKLLIGSLGSLAVITRLNFRTFPSLAASRGFVTSFPNAEGALALRRAIAESPLTPLTFDVLSPELAQIFATRTPATPEVAVFSGENHSTDDTSLPVIGDWFRPREWQLCAAFGGTPEVLDRYSRDLTRLAEQARASSTAILDDSTRPSLWGRLRESLSLFLETSSDATIFKISVLPSRHVDLFSSLRQIAEVAGLPHALVARAGGAIYFAILPSSANNDTTLRQAQVTTQILDLIYSAGGDATLLFAPRALKQHVSVWGAPRQDLALMRRLKNAFDPQNILAPGRYAGGI